LKIFYRSFNIFNGHFPWRNSNFKPSGVNALSLGLIADADNGNARYENQDETYVLHATIE
jgi:hypothetical protein